MRPTQSTIIPNLLCTSWHGQGLYVRPVGSVLGSDLAAFTQRDIEVGSVAKILINETSKE